VLSGEDDRGGKNSEEIPDAGEEEEGARKSIKELGDRE